MAERVVTRLQTPADENGIRTDLDPITSADAVIFDKDHTLKEKLDDLADLIVISPNKPSHACLWIIPTSIDEIG